MIPEQHRKKAAWLALCVAIVAPAEGLRQKAYLDPVGIPTICFGETKGVRMGEVKTTEECKGLLGDRLEEFGRGVDSCTSAVLTPTRKAALTSFAYNVGVRTYCTSSVRRLVNAGDVSGACNALLLYNKARYLGVVVTLPGLTKRRQTERDLCLQP